MFAGTGLLEAVMIGVNVLLSIAIPIIAIVTAVLVARRAAASTVAGARSVSGSERDSQVTGSWRPGTVWSLLVITACVVLGTVGFFVWMVSTWGWEPALGAQVFILVSVILTLALLNLALLIAYVAIAVRSPIPALAKVMWCVALFLGGFPTYPFVFYFLVWVPYGHRGRRFGAEFAAVS